MEDKRIRKTKKTLKTTLIKMLKEETFDQVSITELCKNADISRITFYSHYSDKFALVDDIFADMQEIGYADYRRRQQEYNPSGSVVQGYVNVLDTILDLYYARFDFFRHTDPEKNPYLAFAFYNIVLDTVEQHTSHIEQRNLKLKYSARKIAGFVCFGLLGFINECHQEKTPLEQIRGDYRKKAEADLKKQRELEQQVLTHISSYYEKEHDRLSSEIAERIIRS